MSILDRNTSESLNQEEKDYRMLLKGWRRIDETSLNRIMSHGEHGYIIISSQRSSLKSCDPSLSLTSEFEKWAIETNSELNEGSENSFLAIRNSKAELELNKEIKLSGYAYSPLNSGYYDDKPVLSYIVYNHRRNDKAIYDDFEMLFQLALKWCKDFQQECIYVQFPNEAPHYYNAKGEIFDSQLSSNFKFNRDNEYLFTPAKPESNKHQKITADFQIENLYRKSVTERVERMKRTQNGEVIFDDIDLTNRNNLTEQKP